MRRKVRMELNGNIKYKKIILNIVTFIILYITLVTSIITKKYDLQIGDIAPTNIKASKEVVDELTTQLKKEEAAAKIPMKYSKDIEVQKQSEATVTLFFDELEKILIDKATSGTETEDLDSKINIEDLSGIKGIDNFNFNNDEKQTLINIDKEKLVEYEEKLKEALRKTYDISIEEGNTETIEYARNVAKIKIDQSINDDMNKVLYKMAVYLIKPNISYDKAKTEELKQEARDKVEDTIYRKDQTIVREGEPISEAEITVLDKLGLLNNSKFNIEIFLSLASMIFIAMYLQYSYLKKFCKHIYNDFSKLIMINLLNVMTVVFAVVFAVISPYLIPLACIPILLTLLLDYKSSLVLSIINIILIAIAVKFNANVLVLTIISSILGATSLRKMQQRNDILYSSIYIAVVSGIITLSITVLGTNLPKEIIVNSMFTIAGVLLSGVLATGLLPFFESAFDIVTTVKLLELSNPNNPLLKRLLMEAPGTYHHSVLVANLSELATEEIGGNSLLARIGAYYHDVGKIKRPYFFRENQIGKENPHDKITANLSTLVIISHVKDGLELAKEYNMPKVIQDFIVTHQGDTLVKYFYLTVKNNSENPDEVKEEDFKYPGPRPESKEQGIVMLADSVEAAVRSINDPSAEKIEKMVNNIVKDKLDSGQLENCELTFRDIDIIKKCFLKALGGIYHQRIEYPTDNKTKEK